MDRSQQWSSKRKLMCRCQTCGNQVSMKNEESQEEAGMRVIQREKRNY